MAEQSSKCKSGRGFPVFGLIPLNSPLLPQSLWCPKMSDAELGSGGPARIRGGSSGEGPWAVTTLSGFYFSWANLNMVPLIPAVNPVTKSHMLKSHHTLGT